MLCWSLVVQKMESVVAVLSRYEGNVRWISKHYGELKNRFKVERGAVLKKSCDRSKISCGFFECHFY